MKQQAANVWLMQKMNRAKVLQYIRSHPNVARPQVAAATGLSLSSLTNITAFLLEKGLVCESGVEQVGRVGRKGVLLSFRPGEYGFFCLLLSPGTVRLALTDLSGCVLAESETGYTGGDFSSVMPWLKQETTRLSNQTKCPVLAMGAAVSGLVLNGRLALSSTLGFKEQDIQRELENAVRLPVFVENTTMARATWQFCNAEGHRAPHMLFVDLDGGVGAAQFYGERVSHAMIGEIGHTSVAKEGDSCFCGNRGCLEVMCAPVRMCDVYRQKTGRSASPAELESLQRTDEAARAAVREGAAYLGMGLANLVNLFNPQTLYISRGSYVDMPSALAFAVEEMHRRAYRAITKDMQVETVSSGHAELVGGVAIGLCDRVFAVDFPHSLLD